MQFLLDNLGSICLVLAIVFMFIGIMSKKLVPIMIAIALIVCMAIAQPEVFENVKNIVVNKTEQGIDPMKDEDYKDITDDLDGFEDKIKPEKKPDIFTRP